MQVYAFMGGAVAMASFTAGLFFLRFWKDTRDRLFAMFGVAFFVLGLNRVALSLTMEQDEARTVFYVVRLVAYLLILIAIIDKNRKGS
jgi:hypothetical protein